MTMCDSWISAAVIVLPIPQLFKYFVRSPTATGRAMVNWSGSWAKTRKKTHQIGTSYGDVVYIMLYYIYIITYVYIYNSLDGKTTPSSCGLYRGLYNTYNRLPILEQISSATVSFRIYSYI